MKQVKFSELKKLQVGSLQALLPFEVIADGVVIAEVAKPEKLTAICPGCGRTVTVSRPEPKLDFFSVRSHL